MANSSAEPESIIIRKLTDFKNTYKPPPIVTVAQLNLDEYYLEVAHRSRSYVLRGIERLLFSAHRSIETGDGYFFSVPSRDSADQKYVPILNRIALVKPYRVKSRSSTRLTTARTAAQTLRVIDTVHELLSQNLTKTIRDVYYDDKELFGEQSVSDSIIDDVACMLSCSRISLNVTSEGRGRVIGSLKYITGDGSNLDCTHGVTIPEISEIEDMQTNVLFVLLVDKHAVFTKLAKYKFYTRFHCLIVTSKGQPDVATRSFLQKLRTSFNLPILALMDGDPYGLKILSVFAFGSKNLSYDGANLTTPDIKWLGIRPNDLDKYDIPPEARSEMTEHDIKYANDFLKEDFVQKNPRWVDEITMMLGRKEKVNIEVLSTLGLEYLLKSFLPRKLFEKDWI